MALSSTSPWSTALKLSDIATFFNCSKTVKTCCSHSSINKWARYKPIKAPKESTSGSLSLDRVTIKGLWNSNSVYDVRTRSGFTFSKATSLSSISYNTSSKTLSFDTFKLQSLDLYRMGDFNGYYHNSKLPIPNPSFSGIPTDNKICTSFKGNLFSFIISNLDLKSTNNNTYYDYLLSIESMGMSSYKVGLLFISSTSVFFICNKKGFLVSTTSGSLELNSNFVFTASDFTLSEFSDNTYTICPALFDASSISIGSGDDIIDLLSDDSGISTLATTSSQVGTEKDLRGNSFKIEGIYTLPVYDYSTCPKVYFFRFKLTSLDIIVNLKKTTGIATINITYKTSMQKDFYVDIALYVRKTAISEGTTINQPEVGEFNALKLNIKLTTSSSSSEICTTTITLSLAATTNSYVLSNSSATYYYMLTVSSHDTTVSDWSLTQYGSFKYSIS